MTEMLAISIEPELRERLILAAQLRGMSLEQLVGLAIEYALIAMADIVEDDIRPEAKA